MHLSLGALSLLTTIYYRRRGDRAFNRFIKIWLLLVLTAIIISEVFIRWNLPGAFLFKK